MADPAVILVVSMDEQGGISWNSSLSVPLLNLLLDRVKADVVAVKTTPASPIVAPTNGDLTAITRRPHA